jgi:hypothetical protein
MILGEGNVPMLSSMQQTQTGGGGHAVDKGALQTALADLLTDDSNGFVDALLAKYSAVLATRS